MRDDNRWRQWFGSVSCALVIFIALSVSIPLFDSVAPSPNAAPQDESSELRESMPPANEVAQDAAPYQPDTVLVGLEDDASPRDISAALAALPCVASATVDEQDMALGFAQVKLTEDYEVEEAADAIELIEGIRYAEPNHIYHLADAGQAPQDLSAGFSSALSGQSLVASLAATIDDAYASELWHLEALDGIDAYGAWEMVRGEETKTPVTVAVLDSGCKVDHADLTDNVVACYDAIKNTNTCVPATRDSSHGTHVCGIISAVANNEIGVAGVTYNSKILPVKIFDDKMETTAYAIARALAYVVTNKEAYNIRVVNLSLGGSRDKSYDRTILEGIKKTYQAGIIVVCAAGNANADQGLETPYAIFPGDDVVDAEDGPYGLSVISLDKGATRSSFSNYNVSGSKNKDVAAPGAAIYSTKKTTALYGIDSGTSMAAPIVSGIAALMFTANPDLEPGEAIEIIRKTATDIGKPGFDDETGYGEVNAARAVRAAIPALIGADVVYEGAQETLAAPFDGPCVWRTSDSSVASVEGGVVKGLSIGTATIMAVGETSRALKVISVEEAPPVIPEKLTADTSKQATEKDSKTDVASTTDKGKTSQERSTSTAHVQNMKIAPLSPVVYTGKAMTPEVKVSVNGKVLDAKQYAVSYENNTHVGTALVKVTGKGAYSKLSASAHFVILRASQELSMSTRTVTLKARSLKKRARAVKCITGFAGNQGDLVFKRISGSKKLAFNTSTGVVTVKKKAKRATYKLKVSVYARACDDYKRSNTVVKTIKVRVK